MAIIKYDDIPGWPDVPEGIFIACEEALAAAGLQVSVSRAPDGVHCSDEKTGRSVLENYTGSSAHLAWLRSNPSGTGLLDKLAEVYAEKIAAGRSYGGKSFQIDAGSQTKIAGMSTLAGFVAAGVPGMAWPDNFGWIADDNTVMPLTAFEMLAFGQDIANYVSALVMQNRALKDAINAAASVKELAAIDITMGWPSN